MNPDSSDLHYIMEKILILDFGSQYTQLIARRVRELNVYCEIHPFNKIPVPDASVRGVILSGSPFSVRDEHAPAPDLSAIKGKLPLLGPLYVRDTEKTFMVTKLAFDEGVFINPVIPPACAPQDTLVRVALMATHTKDQIDRAVEKLVKAFKALDIL